MRVPRVLSFLIIALLLTSCIQAPRMRSGTIEGGIESGASEEIPADGNTATDSDVTPTPSNCDSDPNQIGCPGYDRGMPELTHIVDPFDGSYQTKVSVPKNFTGTMYLAGINISSLNDRLIHVKFSFGRGLEPVLIPARPGRGGSGITPTTESEVLILNVQGHPFYYISLLYSLFDYNNYDGTSDDPTDKDGFEQETPVTDPRDGGLYCRGLKIEYDPTFTPTATNPLCNQAGNVCKYAYASLHDQGLYYDHDSDGGVETDMVARVVKEPQIDLLGNGYANIDSATALKKCLPDSYDLSTLNAVLGLSLGILPSWGDDIGLGLGVFKGPFYPANKDQWEISGGALFSEVTATGYATGLFQKSFDSSTDPAKGYRSFLFPRGGKMSLGAGIDYIGASDGGRPFDTAKGIQRLDSSGDSNYMDGCNFRVTGYNPFTNEGISSCNVTAKIEIIERDPITQVEEVIASTTKLKLQLIAPSNDLADATGSEDILYSPIKSCETSRSCGGDECCFNGRCWSKDLVTQCREDAVNAGLFAVGEYCVSDYQCASLCCDTSRSVCAVHQTTDIDEPVLCQKAPGQQCVAKEYCAQENISHCNIYKTDFDEQGNQRCDIRCFTVKTHGDCVNGFCVVPQTPTVPDFDPATYDCSQALDYPTTGFQSN